MFSIRGPRCFFLGYIAFIVIRGRFASATRGATKVHRQVDVLEKALLLLVIPANLFVPLLYLFTPLLNFANYELPVFAPWCGAVLMLVAVWLFWRSHPTSAATGRPAWKSARTISSLPTASIAASATPCTPPSSSTAWPRACSCQLARRLVFPRPLHHHVPPPRPPRGADDAPILRRRLPRIHGTHWATAAAVGLVGDEGSGGTGGGSEHVRVGGCESLRV